MISLNERHSCIGLSLLASLGVILVASCTYAVQSPHPAPATHERQCVPTGEIPPGDARTITVIWGHPFATEAYEVIGAVSEAGESRQAIELAHIVMPHTPTTAAAVVFNRDPSAAQSGLLCLDASAQ